jgi:WD40 repeat protein
MATSLAPSNPALAPSNNSTSEPAPEPASSDAPLFVSFNQDSGCFAVGLDGGASPRARLPRSNRRPGFRIYNVNPFQEMFRRDFASGGIGIVEMLFRSNILALVGGGLNPRHPPHKVMIWDDHQSRSIGEISFKSDVLAVRLRRDRVVVVVSRTVYSYNFRYRACRAAALTRCNACRDLKLVDRIETVANPLGLCALSPGSSRSVLACPGRMRGRIRVELYDLSKSTHIQAHESDLVAIALNTEGSLVATASEKGTLIRVFDTSTGALVHELRRGAERAVIHCICFNAASTFLACSSDKGTIHIFSLSPAEAAQAQQAQEANTTSTLGFFRGILPKYFSSEWSYAQFRVPETNKTICAFGAEKNTIVVVGVDGTFYVGSFENGGECQKKFFARFVRKGEDAE